MAKIRVLVVDDSVVIRRMLSDCLATDPEIEVVGAAADGKIAIARIAQLAPDIVTLDMEMPVMDGLETLRNIRRANSKLPVVMFSTLTERGANATFDALALGANGYVTKPANVGSAELAMQRIHADLVPLIKSLCRRPVAAPHASLRTRCDISPGGPARPDVLAIGVSTGGPQALATLLPALGAHFPVPIVIVQHMPPLFTRLLADRITAISGLRTREGEDGALLVPGECWIAPGGLHMEVGHSPEGPRISLHEGPLENSCRPSVDVLFRSVAATYGRKSLAVVLTGMGQDGLVGSQYIHDAGGRILAQDEASSVVWGMPGAVAHAAIADKILPLASLPAEILLRTHRHTSITQPPRPTQIALGVAHHP